LGEGETLLPLGRANLFRRRPYPPMRGTMFQVSTSFQPSCAPAAVDGRGHPGSAVKDQASKPLVGFGDPVFDPVERATALAARARLAKQEAVKKRPTTTRAYSELWRGASLDRAELAKALPSLLDSADELKAVAAKLGASKGDIHLDKDASETMVKRAPLADYRVVYFAAHGLVAG
jgi:hypothetical protein